MRLRNGAQPLRVVGRINQVPDLSGKDEALILVGVAGL